MKGFITRRDQKRGRFSLEDKKKELYDKFVAEIRGNFYVPSYQRGYRWGTDEVTRLLEDISASTSKFYCLQPVVVMKNKERYELIDGQQRLTTIYLIYKYMHMMGGPLIPEPQFSILYETRKETSEQFLKNDIDLSLREDNIDYWFMCQAYDAIDVWFKKKGNVSSFLEVASAFEQKVSFLYNINIQDMVVPQERG